MFNFAPGGIQHSATNKKPNSTPTSAPTQTALMPSVGQNPAAPIYGHSSDQVNTAPPPSSGDKFFFNPSQAAQNQAANAQTQEPTPPVEEAPKPPWEQENPYLAEQDSLYADIMDNLSKARDQIVQQGQNAIAGQQRQAAYVTGMLGNSFGGSLVGGQSQAFLDANQQMQNNLLNNQRQMQDAQLGMLDRRLGDWNQRQGYSAEDYFMDKGFTQDKERELLNQEAEARANEALETPDPQVLQQDLYSQSNDFPELEAAFNNRRTDANEYFREIIDVLNDGVTEQQLRDWGISAHDLQRAREEQAAGRLGRR